MRTFMTFIFVLWVPVHSVTLSRKQRGLSLERCPNGAVRHDESCYIVAHSLANWPEAYVYCQAYGGHLAFIESDREQQFLTQYLKNVSAGSTDSGHYYWLGGTDAVSEGEWFWARSLEPVTYSNWAPGNPNNDPAHQDHHQDCMAIYGSTGLWDDGYCETTHNFICELELDVEEIVG